MGESHHSSSETLRHGSEKAHVSWSDEVRLVCTTYPIGQLKSHPNRVPLNHPFIDGIFPYKPAIGVPRGMGSPKNIPRRATAMMGIWLEMTFIVVAKSIR